VEDDTTAETLDAVLLPETPPASTWLRIVLAEVLNVGILETTATLLELEGTIWDELLELRAAEEELLDAEPRAGGSHIEVELVVLCTEFEGLTLEAPASLTPGAVLVLVSALATFDDTGASDDDNEVKAVLLLAEDCTVVEPRAGGSHIEVEEEEEDGIWVDTEELCEDPAATCAALDEEIDEELELDTELTELGVESTVELELSVLAPREGGSHMEDEDRLEEEVEVVPGLGGLLLAATLLDEDREDCCDEDVSEEDVCDDEDCCDEETTVEVEEETCVAEEAEL